jgi:hypothetical protein
MHRKKSSKPNAKKSKKEVKRNDSEDTKDVGATEAEIAVLRALPPCEQPMDKTLGEVGLPAETQRKFFRESVYKEVQSQGYKIERDDIPTEPNSTIREIIDSVVTGIQRILKRSNESSTPSEDS